MTNAPEWIKEQTNELIESAYQRGYKVGREYGFYEGMKTIDENIFIEQGRNEAWAVVENLMRMNLTERTNIFAEDGKSTYEIITSMTVSEVIEKIKAYEEQKKRKEDSEIHVGDEVRSIYVDIIGIVTHISEIEGFSILWSDGSVGKRKNTSDFKKTGRTFSEIAEVLKKLQEGKE